MARQIMTHASGKDASLQRAETAWVRKPLSFTPHWQALAQAALNTRGQPLDFTASDAVGMVNDWASNATHGAIPELIEHLPDKADFILASGWPGSVIITSSSR